MKEKSINPFAASLKIDVLKVYSKERFFVQDDWKEEDGIKLPVGAKINEREFQFSFYAEQIESVKITRNKGLMQLMMHLSDRSCKMLLYVIQKLPKNSDIVEIDRVEYMKESGVQSAKTMYNSITDLCDAGVIAKYKPGKYWINPAILFGGNRVAKYPDKLDVVAKVQSTVKQTRNEAD